MSPFNIEFNEAENTVKGNGSDKVGEYDIEGILNKQTQRVALKKKYRLNTGDAKENLGHTVKIRLKRINNEKFEGMYYVNTDKFEGVGEWSMKCTQAMNEACVEVNAHITLPTDRFVQTYCTY